MINNRKNGFTLVELLAVIAVLGLIIIIAIPKVMDTLNTQKKRTLELTTKSIIKAAEEKYLENSAYGINEEITCESVSNITSSDFKSCKIFFDESGNASVTIVGKGRYDGINVCKGTKTSATAGKDDCPIECTSDEMLIENAVVTKPYVVKNASACSTYFTNLVKGMGAPDEVVADFVSVCNGNVVEEMTFNDLVTSLLDEKLATEVELVKNNVIEGKIESSCKKVKGLQCTYDGELVQGAEFNHNQYTYRYMQEYSVEDGTTTGWKNIIQDGWGVILTDKTSTDSVNTQVCSYINGKPLVSTSMMFVEIVNGILQSQATSIDVSSWNTENVINMTAMFGYSNATEIKGLNKLDTSKVIDMGSMFWQSAATSLDLSGLDTSNVTNMYGMFAHSAATSLDLSGLDTSKVTDMSDMFYRSAATTIKLPTKWTTGENANMSSMFDYSAAISLDLSGLDTSKVVDMSYMFRGSKATTGYARTQADADKLNASSNKPTTLTFVVKNNTN